MAIMLCVKSSHFFLYPIIILICNHNFAAINQLCDEKYFKDHYRNRKGCLACCVPQDYGHKENVDVDIDEIRAGNRVFDQKVVKDVVDPFMEISEKDAKNTIKSKN